VSLSRQASKTKEQAEKRKRLRLNLRVKRRSFEQPSPEVCSIRTLGRISTLVNSSSVPRGRTSGLAHRLL
jgi:hypothetical protein